MVPAWGSRIPAPSPCPESQLGLPHRRDGAPHVQRAIHNADVIPRRSRATSFVPVEGQNAYPIASAGVRDERRKVCPVVLGNGATDPDLSALDWLPGGVEPLDGQKHP